ncbi:DUF262 domain-containing protein [Oxynema aestuarii]|jgi:hypothetical protein|uniref:DUF262 domain-containing protein n=1 Tax=Oxynema aestuarii AP17 TaxID=2064643 RepID=A0A6H1U1P0_9CYAN|nr:DUF262 domain-containing protein [Oxynema aestuarii]QIZ71943.1 DUF262 domain-containing protein [Oxynema aestuarii AP17]
MAETYYFINDLIQDIQRGRIRIPSFQRGFVWEQNRVSYFIDSIYRGFPFGSILLWRTKNPLRTERNLGPYKLLNSDLEYPIDYVLDGQQRITSIFGIFQNTLSPEENQETNWTNLFFEIESEDTVPFKYLEDSENYDTNKFFPLKYVFNSSKYRKATRSLDEDLAEKIDGLVDRFQKARIPIERFENEEKKYVATVFERINRQKIDLNTFDLLSVWNWSEEFDLQEQFKELSEELESFGFKDIGSDLLLKCCSAAIMSSVNPEAFLDLPGDTVRQEFEKIKNGIFNAIDFLKVNFNIFSIKLLPMENILVVLTCFFASSSKEYPLSSEQCTILIRWFWRSCFSQRYSRGGVKVADTDLQEVEKLKNGNPSELGNFSVTIEPTYFLNTRFYMSSIATRTFILLLAQNEPLNMISSSKITLTDVLSKGNKNEFHHIFPKAYLERKRCDKKDINCLANFCMLSRSDNNTIKDSPPSDYCQNKMSKDVGEREKILESNFCSITEMLNDDFNTFLKKRAELLCNKAIELCQ